MSIETLVAFVGACVILVHFICVADKMGLQTNHRIRAAYGLVGMAAFAVALGPLYGSQPSWADATVVVAIAVFMLTERRGRHA